MSNTGRNLLTMDEIQEFLNEQCDELGISPSDGITLRVFLRIDLRPDGSTSVTKSFDVPFLTGAQDE